MLAAIGDAKTCPHGHPIFDGRARARRPARRRRGGRQGARPALRERGRGPAPLPEGQRACIPGSRARSPRSATTRSRSRRTASATSVTRSVAETVSVTADPSPPAAHGAPRPAGAGQGALRPLAAEHRRPAAAVVQLRGGEAAASVRRRSHSYRSRCTPAVGPGACVLFLADMTSKSTSTREVAHGSARPAPDSAASRRRAPAGDAGRSRAAWRRAPRTGP